MDERTQLPRVGMVGGGQLARMTHQAAIELGQSLRVLSVSADDSAALVAPDVVIGRHDDRDALLAFAAGCDVITFDHEHVPAELVQAMVDAGHAVHPGPQALPFAQDKALMRERLAGLGAPVPPFAIVPAEGLTEAAEAFAGLHGWPVVIKTARGGYDGRGVWVMGDAAAVRDLSGELADAGVPLVLEPLVPLERELAVVIARSPFGQAAAWPVVQTVQRDGICVQVIAPAPDLDPAVSAAATTLALRIAGELDVVGVLAVELFQVPRGPGAPDGLLVNELAMRPHNSAHWTQDGALTSQFEQHLRAVLDYPLGRTDLLAPCTVMGNVLGGTADGGDAVGMDERVHHLAARFPQVKVHLYGKAFRPGRKLGHVNVVGSDVAELRRIADLAARWLGDGVWPDGWEPHQDPGTDVPPVVRTLVTGAVR